MFSVVILPNEESRKKIIALKQVLQKEIGDFAAWDNEPHITLNYFKEATKAKLEAWQQHLEACTKQITSTRITFDRIQNFSNGALVLLADDSSNTVLKKNTKTVNSNRPKGFVHIPSRPHITIARKLNSTQMKTALSAIDIRPIAFTVKAITFRQLEVSSGEYIVLDNYDLS